MKRCKYKWIVKGKKSLPKRLKINSQKTVRIKEAQCANRVLPPGHRLIRPVH